MLYMLSVRQCKTDVISKIKAKSRGDIHLVELTAEQRSISVEVIISPWFE